MFRLSLALLLCLVTFAVRAQFPVFTHQDTLRGSITPERQWWDLTHYDLHLDVHPNDSTLRGHNVISYRVLETGQRLQIDLQPPMQLTKATQDGKTLKFRREGNAYFVDLKKAQVQDSRQAVTVYFEGKPHVSTNPPWSGGLTWQKDANGMDFITTTCQGDGASLWWPCKDHMYDEPDSMLISVTVPEPLMDVSNGRLRATIQNDNGTRTFVWGVVNPINNYGVNLNIGDYVHFSETYAGEKGPLDCHYYVLRGNERKARAQFRDATRMLEAFEHWFGPYPFYEDSYKLVEVPYPGMEHQSSVTYGNGYKNGYRQKDVSGTGWGFNFDFIIVHESGHEWFANNITYKDIADMWVHEGFTAYSENLFVDYFYGTEACNEYVIGTRKNILNNRPIIGAYDVNYEGSGDMYSKGANLLHTLRQVANDDEKWRSILRGLNQEFYHQTVTTQQIEDYIAQQMGMDLRPVFDQYLRDVRIPLLEYYTENGTVHYRWTNCVYGFALPIRLLSGKKSAWLSPTTAWQAQPLPAGFTTFQLDPNFYVQGMYRTTAPTTP
ncbi:Peptidase family M1 [Catalinimonas alkaloidigena]|uniref:Peptidase family M1 n=1 Tax=Catalinimonas alkaloidigena TaxID=1075417 RepID=A0A1G9A068_9BACT|nr:M1 family metallopeptidase [Catalinimonas alkaloidigena]SDK20597.1 Peptidase family M1 [Catalinimonas alkaloidigena]